MNNEPLSQREPTTPEEFVRHPSFRREVARIEQLGGSVQINLDGGKAKISLSPGPVRADIISTFAERIRRLDSKGLIEVTSTL